MKEHEKTFKHESYGMIGYSRVSHNMATTRLFGSAIDKHTTTIRIRISTAKRRHSLSVDWFIPQQQIVDVELSASQFAEFLTTGNMGDGVPCTIRHLNGHRMENPPAELVEAAEVREGFTSKCRTLGTRVATMSKAVNEILAGPKIGKTEKEKIRRAVECIVTEVGHNLPFVLDQFHEATDRILSVTKAEADAFLTHAITRAGLQALQNPRATLLDKPEDP